MASVQSARERLPESQALFDFRSTAHPTQALHLLQLAELISARSATVVQIPLAVFVAAP